MTARQCPGNFPMYNLLSDANPHFVACLVGLMLAFSASAESGMTEAIKVSDDNTALLVVHARGVQIYQCVLATGVYQWQWQAPDAQLFDKETNKRVGTHGAGPSWTYEDGSGLKAKVIQKVDAPAADAAPWLLLKVTARTGNGVLTKANFIQRINTEGGTPPPLSLCNSNHLGGENRVAYHADYVFFGVH